MVYHCFFEQSGTFKNELKKLGYQAYDYDICDVFGETDYKIDLFQEIENAYMDKVSIFDNIKENDMILAFFPCIRFEITKNLWNIPPAKASERGHDAPFPHEIPKRFVEIMTVPSDYVFEPFAGSGTTLEVCRDLDRNCIASEISQKYFNKIVNRINHKQTTIFDYLD